MLGKGGGERDFDLWGEVGFPHIAVRCLLAGLTFLLMFLFINVHNDLGCTKRDTTSGESMEETAVLSQFVLRFLIKFKACKITAGDNIDPWYP